MQRLLVGLLLACGLVAPPIQAPAKAAEQAGVNVQARARPQAAPRRLWAARFKSLGRIPDLAYDLAASPDGGRVYVTGSSGKVGAESYVTIAYDPLTGGPLWEDRYQGPEKIGNVPNAIAVSPDGSRVFVTGRSQGSGQSYQDYATLAYDAATGTRLWVARYDSGTGGSDQARAIAVSPDGATVVVTGSSGIAYMGTVAYEASTGHQLWVQTFTQGYQASDGQAVKVSPDGARVFVTGYSYSGSTDDAITIAYDLATGAQIWLTNTFGGPDDELAFAMGVSPDGDRIFIAGETRVPNSIYDFLTIALDSASGAVLWTRTYDGPAGSNDVVNSMASSPDGSRVVVTGRSHGGALSRNDMATIAYDATSGQQLWVTRFDGPAHLADVAYAVGMSPDGLTAYVAGSSHGTGTGIDYATIGYSAVDGTQLWVKRYNDAVNRSDFAHALAVSADGSTVFATGWSAGRVTNLDWVTIAYGL